MVTTVPFARRDVPVLMSVDAVIAGGSCAGVAAAEALARAGWQVALVEPRTYLGREMSATLRPWLPATGGQRSAISGQPAADTPDDNPSRPTSPLHAFVDAQESAAVLEPVWGERPVSLHALKLFLEDRLLAAGVRIFYASLPVAVTVEDGAASGLVIGNKSGRQLIHCRTLIDATENGLVAGLIARKTSDFLEKSDVSKKSDVYARTLEFDGVGSVDGPVLAVPTELGLVEDHVRLHRGYRGPEHVLVECRLELPSADFSSTGWAAREGQARRLTTRVAAYLLQEVESFAGATLAAASHELYGPQGALREPPLQLDFPVHGERPVAERQHLGVGQEVALPLSHEKVAHVPVQAFAGPVANLWQLNETAPTSPKMRAAMREPLAASAAGAQLAAFLQQQDAGARQAGDNGRTREHHPSRPASPAQRPAVGGQSSPSAMTIREPMSPRPGRHYRRANVAPYRLPVIAAVDVLVVGGGTSGATAALIAARTGLQTALVEMNPGLGGTGTYGGVHSYWFGRRVGFAAQVTALATAMHEKLRQPPPEGPVPRWNIEAKSQALREAVEGAGVALYLNAMVIGAVVEDRGPRTAKDGTGNGAGWRPALGGRRSVLGVAVATRQGPVVLLGRVIVDATGDGDVAAHAGAQTTYGAARDHVVMWYSLAQFARPGRTRNNFTSMVDVSNVHDYTRAILAGRRRLRERDHDHGIYVAPRESRHVLGDVQLTLNDQLLQRRWRDVINVTFSNHDVKGHSTSDWLRLGLIPPNLEVEIPYRALLPRGLHGILVVGKAISVTHDALPATRMQADMENLGGAAALAAAYAVRHGCDLRKVDVAAVQEQLVEAGVLPPEIRRRRLVPWRLEGKALARAVAALDARPLTSYADMEMDEVYRQRLLPVDACCAGAHAVPALEAELARSSGERRLLLAQLLALVGSRAGVPVLLQALQQALAGEELPVRSSHIRYAGAPPDQGAMPQEVYWLHALGMARDRRALPVWQRVVDLLAGANEDDVTSGVKGVFYYVEAVCAGAERLGSPRAIPLLRQLHGYAPFHGLVCREGHQDDFFAERRAHLELLIARALARCGSPAGAALLIDYLNDARALLAAHAHSELVAIGGQDLGLEAAPWAQWLEAQGESLAPKPYDRPTAPMRMWGEEILVEETSDFLEKSDVLEQETR